ncbi:MAG: hypothetical protein ACE37F_27815 [Nannocystaceae bacterium]|nr:hypothetical protein [bacterium]
MILGCVLVGAVACDGGSSAADTDAQSTEETGASPTSGASGGSGSAEGGEGVTGSMSGGSSTSGASDDDDTGITSAGTGLPDGDGCCDAHAGPSCNEQSVAVCVCAAEPECCVFDWFESCAELAQSRCDAACDSDGSSTSDTDAGSETAGMACDETVLIELGAVDADLSGDWSITTSQAGEGEIAVVDGNADGEVRWDVDIPCDDTWIIWVRLFDQGSADSFFATLDGEPSPPAIFEGGIQGPGQGWNWRDLNWRDPDDAATFIEDPWAPQWAEGQHSIALSYRESVAVARIEITNDPDYAP